MSIEDILQNAPKYMEVVSAYGLDVAGGDLQVDENGDIAVTLDGDLKFGNDRINAMHRLVQRWCFNVPIIGALFSLAAPSHRTIPSLAAQPETIPPLIFSSDPTFE